MNIVFFGAGSMAEAIISGWVSSPELPPLQLYVTNRSDSATLERLKSQYTVNLLHEQPEHLSDADFIVLAMKPKDASEAFPVISQMIPAKATILSVLAGIDVATLRHSFPGHPIFRIMPNTSATIGKSATAISYCQNATEQQIGMVKQLFQAIGTVEIVPDRLMHAVTALSGSGPAYVYYLTELLEKAALEQGIPSREARALILQTIDGAISMLRETKEEPATLRKRVTSPGGTTEAGIAKMTEQGLDHAIVSGIDAASKQSVVLGQLLKDSIVH